MINSELFAFTEVQKEKDISTVLPYLPLTLSLENNILEVSGLLDTGATVNVLPYQVGIKLGAVWEQQTIPLRLTGNLAQVPARVLVLQAKISQFQPVRLAFAWTRANEVPLLLGQVNFFLEFDVCFFRSQSVFEICPKK